MSLSRNYLLNWADVSIETKFYLSEVSPILLLEVQFWS